VTGKPDQTDQDEKCSLCCCTSPPSLTLNTATALVLAGL
jgi:hypothetical protein